VGGGGGEADGGGLPLVASPAAGVVVFLASGKYFSNPDTETAETQLNPRKDNNVHQCSRGDGHVQCSAVQCIVGTQLFRVQLDTA